MNTIRERKMAIDLDLFPRMLAQDEAHIARSKEKAARIFAQRKRAAEREEKLRAARERARRRSSALAGGTVAVVLGMWGAYLLAMLGCVVS